MEEEKMEFLQHPPRAQLNCLKLLLQLMLAVRHYAAGLARGSGTQRNNTVWETTTSCERTFFIVVECNIKRTLH